MVCTISFSNQNFQVFRVNGKRPRSQTIFYFIKHCPKIQTGKTPEEIRKTFNIKNDFTPEEEEQVFFR